MHYTVSAPWLKGHETMTREVFVEDVDECTYAGDNPKLRHACAPDTTCVNTVGSYTCE